MPKFYKRYKPKGSKYYKYKRRKRPVFGRLDKAAYHMAKKAIGMLNVEYKFHDVDSTSQTVSSAATIVQLTNIPQGDTDITRDGAQVKLTRLNIKYLLTDNGAATPSIRVMLIHDKQTNGAIYAIGDLLANTAIFDSIISPNNLDNKYRFRVLYNKVITFSDSGNQNAYREIFKDLDIRLRFNGSTPSIADLNSDSLSLVFVSTQTTNLPILHLFARLRYVDN